MRNPQRFFAVALSLTMLTVPAFSANGARRAVVVETAAPQSTGALERGYRTGYSDGYQAGYRDAAERAERNFRNKEEYRSADRAYAASYGTLEDYRDGYRQGFEVGYDGGFDHRVFDSTVPTGISRRGDVVVDDDRVAVDDDSQGNGSSSSSSSNSGGGSMGGGASTSTGVRNPGGSVTIPSNTEMRVELLTNLSTDASQKGDPFQARVIEPNEYQGAMIQGHVSRVKRSGRVKGSSELQLSFEQISLGGRWSDFQADTVTKIGTGTAIGAIIGAIAGGGKGAAIGAAIGGAIGTGGAISSRGSDIRLAAGQELRIRTSNTTHIQ
jgi:hypothetical protein